MSDRPEKPDFRSFRAGREPVRIGEWVLHADIGVLRRDDDEVRLTAKMLHALLVLLDAGDRGVSRDELLSAVWGDSYPTDSVISRAMADLRAAFGEKAGEERYIRTLPKFGYQLVATIAVPGAEKSRSRYRYLPGIAAATLVVLLLVVYIAQDDDDLPLPSVLISLPESIPLTTAPGLEHQARISPTDDWVVYAALRPEHADWDLFRISLDDYTSQPVAVTAGVQEHGPAVSPDGGQVAYVRIDDSGCEVVTQSITVGVPLPVARCTGKFATLVDWSPDGSTLVFTGEESADEQAYRRLYTVGIKGTDLRRLSNAVSPTGTDYYPRYSPTGRKVAFLRGEPQPDHRASVWVVDTESGAEQRLTPQPSQIGGITWVDDETIIYGYLDAGRIESRLLDLNTLTEARMDRVNLIHADYRPRDGLLVTTRMRHERDLLLLSADGESRRIASSTSDDHHGRLSPGEEWIVFVSRRSGYDEIWLTSTDTDVTRRLTRYDGASVRYPDWHPNGQRILFTVQTDAGERLYETDVISGAVRPLGQPVSATTPRWMPDGKHWVYGCLENQLPGICIADTESSTRLAERLYRPVPISDNAVAVVDDDGRIQRISTDDGRVQELFPGAPAYGQFSWTVRADSIIYLAPGAAGEATKIMRRDFTGSKDEVLYEGDLQIANATLSVGSSSGAVLLDQQQGASDDLIVFVDALK